MLTRIEQENNSNAENYAGRPTYVGEVCSYTGMHGESCRSETVITKENPFNNRSPERLSELFFEKGNVGAITKPQWYVSLIVSMDRGPICWIIAVDAIPPKL